MAPTLFPHAVQILDWYHLREHVREAARLMHGKSAEHAVDLEKLWERNVRQGTSEVVEGGCKHVVGLRFKRRTTLWTKRGG